MSYREGYTAFRVDLNEEQYSRFAKNFPVGFRMEAVRKLIEMACTSVEDSGSLMLGAILSGELSLVYEPRPIQTLKPSEVEK